ncbi:MAG: hypothetical protein WC408_06785 [Candidatus Micrarchaeia archaeon]|jgi:hypothetical protein
MNKARVFFDLLGKAPEKKLEFSEHFFDSSFDRGIGPAGIEDWVCCRHDALLLATEGVSSAGARRFRLHFRYSKKKLLLVVLDLGGNSRFKVVTFIISSKKRIVGRMRNESGVKKARF